MRGRNILAVLALALAATPSPTRSPAADPPPQTEAVDPLTVPDEDFVRFRDPEIWRGLSVSRISFREGTVTWHLWRIANDARPDGPLWVVPHDNEDAAFDAALNAVRAWGGVIVAVDSNMPGIGRGARLNRDTGGAPPIDPNRNFRDALPRYAGAVLADLGMPPRLIVALHTNAAGFDPSLSLCPIDGASGSGDISVRLCTVRFHPVASRARTWPFDDDDSLALIPYPREGAADSGFCSRRLVRADFNVVRERVLASDGSLSNYASLHGLDYVNIETREPDPGATEMARARDRLVAMIDRTMDLCGNPGGARLRVAGSAPMSGRP